MGVRHEQGMKHKMRPNQQNTLQNANESPSGNFGPCRPIWFAQLLRGAALFVVAIFWLSAAIHGQDFQYTISNDQARRARILDRWAAVLEDELPRRTKELG